MRNHFNIVFTNPVPELGIGNGPVLLYLVKLLKLRVEPLEKEEGERGGRKRRRKRRRKVGGGGREEEEEKKKRRKRGGE